MRKIVAILIAIFLFNTSAPIRVFAKDKDNGKKEHLTRRQKKELKREKKLYERVTSRANDYRMKPHQLVGIHDFKKQTKKEQRRRSKYHIKP